MREREKEERRRERKETHTHTLTVREREMLSEQIHHFEIVQYQLHCIPYQIDIRVPQL